MARDADALDIEKWDAPDADATRPTATRFAEGYGQPFSRQGGPLPPREDPNFIYRALTSMAVELNETGVLEWDSGTTYRHDASGGAAVMRNNGIYISVASSTNIDPAGAGGEASWARLYTKAEVDTLLAAIDATIAGLGAGDLTRAVADTLYLALANAGTAASEDTGTGDGDIPVLGTGGLLDAARLPDASTTEKGAVELATNAEVTTGTDTSRAVTPSGFRSAGDARYVQDSALGTAASEDTGTASGDIPVLGTGGELDADRLPDATTTEKGAVELATNAEAETGTDTSRVITPAGLRAGGDARYYSQSAADARFLHFGDEIGRIDEDGDFGDLWTALNAIMPAINNSYPQLEYPCIGYWCYFSTTSKINAEQVVSIRRSTATTITLPLVNGSNPWSNLNFALNVTSTGAPTGPGIPTFTRADSIGRMVITIFDHGLP